MNRTPLQYQGGDVRPIPDPSELTTEQLQREIASLKELLEMRTDVNKTSLLAMKELFQTRFDDIDKAVKLVRDDNLRFPNWIDEKIGAVAAVNSVRFTGLDTRFEERDSRTEAHNQSSKLAIDAALQAAKEAVSKSEIATVKQIDQHANMLITTTKALDEKIDDVKERLTRIEGSGEGRIANRATNQYVFGLIGLVLGTIIAAVGLLMRMAIK